MGLAPSAERVARYREDGFLCPVPALSALEARDCRFKLEAFAASQGKPFGRRPGQLRAKTRQLFQWHDVLTTSPRRGRIARGDERTPTPAASLALRPNRSAAGARLGGPDRRAARRWCWSTVLGARGQEWRRAAAGRRNRTGRSRNLSNTSHGGN